MADRTQFTFYESFYKALARIRKGADRAKAYDIIVLFALYGEEPDLDALPESVAIAYELVRPMLEASRRKSEAGRKGGYSNRGSKPEAKPKQTGSKTKANDKQTEAKPKQVQVQDKEQEQVKVQDKEQEQVKVQDKEQMLKDTLPIGRVQKRPHPEKAESRFSPPTVQDVGAYCLEAGLRIDAQRFVDFYASKGWKVGSAAMKDWRAAVRNWARDKHTRRPQPVRNEPQVSEYVDTGDIDWMFEGRETR